MSQPCDPYRSAEGTIPNAVVASGDLIECEKVEQALQTALESVRHLIAHNADGMVVVDGNGKVRFVNPAAEVLFGRKAEELLDEMFGFPIVAGETTELDILRKGGGLGTVEMRVTHTDWEGRTAYLASLRDITEQVETRKALRISHDLLEIANRHTEMSALLTEFVVNIQRFTGCAAVGIRLLEEDGTIPYQAYEGFSRRFYESESPLSIYSDRCMCINVVKGEVDPERSFYTGGGSFYMNGTTRFLTTVSEEEKGQTRNVCNQVGYESVALIPIRVEDRILGLIHVADPQEHRVPLEAVEVLEGVAKQLGTAIQRVWAEERLQQYSERLEEMVEERTKALRDAQDQLVRKEKLATLGQLAGGVGHELRNPLSAIKNAAYFLNMVLEDPDPEVKEMLGILEKEVRTSERIITGLLDFARHKPPTRREVKVNEVLQEALSRLTVPDSIEVVTRLDESLPPLSADPDQLLQVFGNLLLNAIQAMPKGGRLVVQSEGRGDPVGRPDPVGCREWVAVSVSDTGVGMSVEQQGKIFEALYTTKARGIGLGLALTKMLVESHGGTIEVHSIVGEGSTFTVRLPVHGEEGGHVG